MTWLILFEDSSVGPEIFTEEEAARTRYAACKLNWSCHLFQAVDPAQPPLPTWAEVRKVLEPWRYIDGVLQGLVDETPLRGALPFTWPTARDARALDALLLRIPEVQ